VGGEIQGTTRVRKGRTSLITMVRKARGSGSGTHAGEEGSNQNQRVKRKGVSSELLAASRRKRGEPDHCRGRGAGRGTMRAITKKWRGPRRGEANMVGRKRGR